MMRQSASRNQRSKGVFRLKLVLQICLLLAICTWLLYQVKHSHDKKKAFEDKASKVALNQPDLFDFGRKSLPLVKENDSMSDTRAKDDDNEEDQREEGEQDQDMKQEEVKDEELTREGDDTIDELDQDRGDEENEQEEEFFSVEEKDGQVGEDDFSENKEAEDSAQEAREENYKRDDASSAVAHDSSVEIEDSKGTVDAMNINNETSGYVNPVSNVSNVSFGENMTATNADPSINGSHSTEVSNQNELKLANTTTSSLPENNVSDNNAQAIQNGPKFNDSASTGEISQLGSSGLIPVQDQNHKTDASEGHEPEDHPLDSTTKNNENGATARADLSAIPVIQNEAKDSDDKAAE